LQLATLSLQGRKNPSEFIGRFKGDNRYIADYLTEEVLNCQPGHLRNSLLQTSILERLSGSLCDAVTLQENSRQTLNTIEKGNLFTIPLDDERRWYRYHHLFADLLEQRLRLNQGDMGAVQNFSRDYIITKLDIRVRYDADIDNIRKIIKKIGKEFEQHEEIGPVLLSPIKSQGVREMDDSAMILRVKFKTPPGEQFVVRREVYKRIQERFREEGIEFAHRNVTVYLPPEVTGAAVNGGQGEDSPADKTLLGASAAAAAVASQVEEAEIKSKD
jgi:hypothetical protein